MRPGNPVVDFGDHCASNGERGDKIICRDSQAVFAARIRRTDLEHRDIARDCLAAEQAAKLRVGRRQDVQKAGLGERAIAPRTAVGGKAQMIGVLWPQEAGVARAEENSAPR